MGVFEALRVLEIRELRGLSDQDVKKAYRKLMGKHHPDKGGDVRKAQMLNEAYSILREAIKKLKVSDNRDVQAIVVVGLGDLQEVYLGKEVIGRSDLGEVGVTRKNIRVMNTYIETDMDIVVGNFVSRFSTLSKWNIADEYQIHGYVECVDVFEEIEVIVKVHGKVIPVKLKDKTVLALTFGSGVKLRVTLEKRLIK